VCTPRSGSISSQTAACEAQDRALETTSLWWPIIVPGGPLGVASAWVDIETVDAEVQAAERTALRATRPVFTMRDAPDRYLLLPRESTTVEGVGPGERQVAKVVFEYDADDLPRLEKAWIVGEKYAVTARGHDPHTGLVLWVQKPEQYGRDPGVPDDLRVRTTFGYDAFAVHVASVANELGHEVLQTHDLGTGTLMSTLGPNAWVDPGCVPDCPPSRETTAFRIDGFGRVLETWVSELDPERGYVLHLASETAYHDTPGTWLTVEERAYQVFGDATSVVRARIEVDASGLVLSSRALGATPGEDAVTYFGYTPRGELETARGPDPASDAALVEIRWRYDGQGREVEVTRPDGTGTATQYVGREVWVEELVTGDPGEPVARTRMAYDVLGNLVAVREWQGAEGWATTSYEYDALGRMARIADPDGIVTALRHDGGGRRTHLERAGGTWEYHHDLNGNQTTIVAPFVDNPLPYTTSIAYDDLDRPVSRIQGARDLSAEEVNLFGDGTATWKYDHGVNGVGRLASSSINTGTGGSLDRQFEYDARGNVVVEELRFKIWNGRFADKRTIRREVGALGQLVSVEQADALGSGEGTRIAVDYDVQGRPWAARWVNRPGPADPGRQMLAELSYSRAGMPVLRRAASDLHRQRWTYDRLGRLQRTAVEARRSATSPWQPAASQDFGYFASDDLATLETLLRVGGVEHTEKWRFAYDDRHQLVSARVKDKPVMAVSYTAGGRLRTAFADYGGDTRRAFTYVYNTPGEGDPETVGTILDEGVPAWELSWDRAGNLRRLGTRATYRYDGADDLREARRGAGAGSSREGPMREVYWYEADGRRRLALTFDAGGEPARLRLWFGDTEIHYDGAGSVTETQVHVSLGAPIARIVDRADVEYTFHGHRHDLLLIVDDDGAATTGFAYTPWGEAVETVGAPSLDHRRRFNGKESDLATGLSYYGFRYYDPFLMLWTQADPLYRFAPDAAWTEPRRANLYTFVLNNPLRYYDPDGLAPWYERTFNVVVGYAEAKIGAALCVSVVGCILGGGMVLDGADRVQSGLTGGKRAIPLIIDKGGEAAGLSPGTRQHAIMVYDSAMGGLTMAGGFSLMGSTAAAGVSVARTTVSQAEASAIAEKNLQLVKNVQASTTVRTTSGAARGAAQATGQLHHAISRPIHRALQQHPVLRGTYQARDPRFVLRAADKAAHRGYQQWHRALDKEVVNWLRANEAATPAQFETYLRSLYQRPDLVQRFPVGFQ
jgi:RHS repeat-associated protein